MNELDNFLNTFGGYQIYKLYKDEVELLYNSDDHLYYLIENGEFVIQPSVTTILHKTMDKSEILMAWACKMMGEKLLRLYTESNDIPILVERSKTAWKDKLEYASNLGVQAHNWIEEWINLKLQYGDQMEPSNGNAGYFKARPQEPNVKSACEAALKWMKDHNVRWKSTEKKIYSRIHRYAGTMDGLAVIDSCNDKLCCRSPFKDRLSIVDWKTSNYLYLEYILQTAGYQFAYIEETGEPVEDRWIIRLGKEDAEFQAWHCDSDTYEGDLFAFLNSLRLYKSLELIESRMKEQLERIKTIRQQEKIRERDESLKIKCKNADKYKGVRKPTCNNGNPCQTCLEIYKQKHLDTEV